MMGGEVSVESVHGKGSTFICSAWFGLSNREPSVGIEIELDQLKGKRVLLVDDHPKALEMMKVWCMSLGMDVETSLCGEEALEQFKASEGFDVVVLDDAMPHWSGLQTAEAFETITGHGSSFILLTPMLKEAPDDNRLSNAGIKLTMAKPLLKDRFLQGIKEIFGIVSEGTDHQHGNIDLSHLRRQLGGTRILLAEDNEINQELAMELLEDVGMIVTVASNGRQALEMLDQKEYDLVLMDVQMPVLDGYGATREIRKNKKYESLPIIAMTANVMTKDLEIAKEVGMNDHIAKPLDVQKMYVTLCQYIDRQDANDGSLKVSSEHVVSEDIGKKGVDVSDMPDLEHVNVSKGLLSCGSKVPLYLKVCQKFVSHQGAFRELFLEAISTSPEDGERLAHTLKGLSGNIGAMELQTKAKILEESCQLGKGTSQAFEEVCSELILVIDELTRLPSLDDGDSVQETHALSQRELESGVARLLERLEDDDSEALDLALELLKGCREPSLLPHLNQVIQSLEEYDFESAMDALEAWNPILSLLEDK
jgi:CheY-like chemotaxis protein/HPt (histidine-containing phosphotransfer) domain-containing protein